ncbi:hypothetical protein BBBOND_0313900 [Babesia bigemina]|uniref:C3H1-type domain-containing protein n=1 Tax=Babesia bigemina TaxID=5866 RepID=A0A061DAB2_BABBI|nr:hypothetical protein BBBOND_0313900 [Babesia bigemina]CDR97488.1 hypothetical protein BBBOND_0313900 [Babesia bigemina]|eukprot:XP_012769674.1 hypothetical protein BBBOND_0313900 [Babesia bigemina]
MGFLSGVLSNIHKHLGQHKGEINNAITSLETNKHAGKKGFSVAIVKVVEGVGGYNDGVMKSNKRVSDPIIRLLEQVNDAFKKQVSELNKNIDIRRPQTAQEAALDAENLVKQSVRNATNFFETLDIDRNHKDIKISINDLNSNLRDRVNIACDSVKLETKHLRELSRKEEKHLQDMEREIERVLTDAGACVNREIRGQVTKLINDMKERVTKIKLQLEDIKRTLTGYVDELTKWIDSVTIVITAALGRVDSILKEVNKGDSSMKPYKIEGALREITASVLILHGAGEAAKAQVKEKVTAALGQVKDMNDALKEDLYKVKGAIKGAIWKHVEESIRTPYEKLEGHVKDGLWRIEDAITRILTPLKTNSDGFYEKIEATQRAIQEAISGVESQLSKLQILDVAAINGETKLLQAIKAGDAFDSVSEYIMTLDTNVMVQVQAAINKMGAVWKKFASGAIYDDVQSAVKEAAQELRALDGIANGTVQITDLQSVTMGKENFQGVDSIREIIKPHVSAIQQILPKLIGRSSSISREEVESILTDLGNIAKSVSQHFKDVLLQVIEVIEIQLASEIGTVAQAINAKVDVIIKGVDNGDESDVPVTYSDGSQHKNSRGLQALVDDFNKNIKQKLDNLKSTVIPQTFKKKDTQNYGDGTKNYDFDHIMKTFKTTYDSINAELEEGKFQKAVADKLNTEIGGDAMGRPADVDRISDLQRGKFVNYEKQVQQDSLIGDEPEKFEGALPKKIRDIKTQVEQALGKIDSEKQYAEEELKKVTTALHELFQLIEEDAQFARGNLTDLRDKYFGAYDEAKRIGTESIQKIKQQLVLLHEIDVTEVIGLADDFIQKDARNLQDKYIKSLNQHVDNQVEDAKKLITQKARVDHVTSTQLLLTHFADRVTAHLKGLPEAIEKDKHTGFKGFMEAFEGKPAPPPQWDLYAPRNQSSKLEEFKGAVTKKQASKKEEFKTLSQEFKKLYDPLNTYLVVELKRHHTETMSNRNPSVRVVDGDPIPHTKNVGDLKDKLDALLQHLHDIPAARKHLFDHNFSTKLNTLQSLLDNLRPASYADDSNLLLECLRKGVQGMHDELAKAYISAYDSETFGGEMFEKQKLTPYGAKFAKICFTVVCTLNSTLTDLTHNCKSLRGQQINKSTDVGRSFVGHGYAVSDATLQNGELQNRPTVAGENVAKRLLLPIRGADDNAHLKGCKSNEQRKDNHFHVFDAIDCIFSHFEQYNELCHLLTASARQHPCSVYDILIWLSGFPYTAVYSTMRDITISDLFDNPHKKAAGDDELELTSTDMAAQSITAHPRNISYNYVRKAVDHICATSYDVLTAVVGTGDSRTVYASDFCNNSFNFHYPSDPSDCLDMLLDLLRRLLPVFRFLELQCNITPEHHGWSHCRYGRDIPTTKSQCNEHSGDEANSQARCQVNCQPTSPLMLYLSDSLPGHLPHQLQSVGCRAKCSTCSKSSPGQPCLLPLGFKGFSGSTKTGRQLCDAIKTFLGTGLISSLMCLLPKPPSTLPEHFQFVLTLVGAFNANRDVNSNAVHAAFVKAIKKQSIDLCADPGTLTGALSDAYKNGRSHEVGEHPKASDSDLSTLSMPTTCNYPNKDVHCAPYLTTLHNDAYHYAAEKHAGLYLSWAVYLPWSFWQCLESLFRAFTNISCQDWGCRRCTHGTACKRGKHGAAYNCQCKGLVECRGVISTLYSFGFTFGNPATLSAAEGKRYCHNFYKQLNNVLNSNYFRTLFEKCDEFIFTIRGPFLWMTVALWSLSLFYLICVMVGRLDVLHIRSHLRIPSSHKITAQSLLAAAQVGRLAKISYLQP